MENLTQKLKDYIIDNIESAKLKEGGPAPSERALAAQFKVSKTLVNKAYKQLVLSGVLTKIPRKGTFITPKNNHDLNIGKRNFVYTLLPSNISLDPEEFYSYNYYETIEGMTLEAGKHGLNIIPLYTSKEEKSFSQNIKRVLSNGNTLGFIDPAFSFKNIAVWFNQREIPFVQFGRSNARDTVWDNHESASREAVEYFFSKGRKNVLFIGVGIHYESEEDKIRGYKAAHEFSGKKVNENLLVFNRKIPEVAGKIALNQIKRNPSIDAVFACNDYTAKSIIDVLLNNKIRIPEDIALIGADDMPGAASFPIPLATIRRPRKKLGSEMVKALIKRCRDLSAPKIQIELESKFIYRKSAG